jgi:hypothetical protein
VCVGHNVTFIDVPANVFIYDKDFLCNYAVQPDMIQFSCKTNGFAHVSCKPKYPIKGEGMFLYPVCILRGVGLYFYVHIG